MKYLKLYEDLFDKKPVGFDSVMSELDLDGFRDLFLEKLNWMCEAGKLKTLSPDLNIIFSNDGIDFMVECLNSLDLDDIVYTKLMFYVKMVVDPMDLYVKYIMKYNFAPYERSIEYMRDRDEIQFVFTYADTGEYFRSIEQLIRTFDWLCGGVYKNNPKAIRFHNKIEIEKAKEDYGDIYKKQSIASSYVPKKRYFKGYAKKRRNRTRR